MNLSGHRRGDIGITHPTQFGNGVIKLNFESLELEVRHIVKDRKVDKHSTDLIM